VSTFHNRLRRIQLQAERCFLSRIDKSAAGIGAVHVDVERGPGKLVSEARLHILREAGARSNGISLYFDEPIAGAHPRPEVWSEGQRRAAKVFPSGKGFVALLDLPPEDHSPTIVVRVIWPADGAQLLVYPKLLPRILRIRHGLGREYIPMSVACHNGPRLISWIHSALARPAAGGLLFACVSPSPPEFEADGVALSAAASRALSASEQRTACAAVGRGASMLGEIYGVPLPGQVCAVTAGEARLYDSLAGPFAVLPASGVGRWAKHGVRGDFLVWRSLGSAYWGVGCQLIGPHARAVTGGLAAGSGLAVLSRIASAELDLAMQQYDALGQTSRVRGWLERAQGFPDPATVGLVATSVCRALAGNSAAAQRFSEMLRDNWGRMISVAAVEDELALSQSEPEPGLPSVSSRIPDHPKDSSGGGKGGSHSS